MPGTTVGGKTGTAQKIDKLTGAYSEKKGWSSFIGFLPAEDPMLLCAVVIDEPANAETGGAAAAPLFKKIMTQIISHPQLEYAERILHQGQPENPAQAKKGKPVPDVCGMQIESAVHFLGSEQIPSEIIGEKNGTIAFQTPKAGQTLDADKKMACIPVRMRGTRKYIRKSSCPNAWVRTFATPSMRLISKD